MSTSQLPTSPEKFQGWIGKDKHSIGHLEHGEYQPKPFTDQDVDIAITHCGICASGMHSTRYTLF
jgi:alcohol dehydrogenase (NADP+)